jgi:hypothetical protein
LAAAPDVQATSVVHENDLLVGFIYANLMAKRCETVSDASTG